MGAQYEDEEEYEEVEDDEEVVEDDSAPAARPSLVKIVVIALIAVIVVTNLVTAIVLWRRSRSGGQDSAAVARPADKAEPLSVASRVPPEPPPKPPGPPAPPPPDRPKTGDAAPLKVKEPAKGPEPEEPKKAPEKASTKDAVAPPPKAGPLKLDPHVAIAAGVAPRLPASDDGQKVVFDTGPFQAVLMPPVPLSGPTPTLKIEPDAGNPEAVLVKHRSTSGIGHDLLLACKRQGGQMVWEINKDRERDYAACLQHLVLVAATGRGGDESHAPCMRKRDTAAAKLTIAYRSDGAIVGGDRTWEFRYPWVQQLLVRHKDVEGGKPIPLFRAPTVMGTHVDITRRDDSGRFPTLAFKGKVQAASRPKPFEIRLVLEFALSDAPNPREGGTVTARLDVVGLREYLADLDSAQAGLRRLKAAGELADLADELDMLNRKKQQLQMRPVTSSVTSKAELTSIETRIERIMRSPGFVRRADTFKNYVRDQYTKNDDSRAAANIRRTLREELLKFRKEADPAQWRNEIEGAIKALDADRGLPQGLFADIEGVTVLDPWGLPLAALTPKLLLEGAEKLESPKARPSTPSKEKGRF